ncbi:uncharacterized protein An01g08250 [Aspergillus niger]|uniref:Contig An01c0290, genomic contig n=2 Tax=Aspergillus niger TaxID=5061 RepID=A2Q9L1_ASPNC|nr:uncharacterized protein An01g08250 [Aspergillus niger]CAK43917.1 unnamed protein product [Aspergillus niger]
MTCCPWWVCVYIVKGFKAAAWLIGDDVGESAVAFVFGRRTARPQAAGTWLGSGRRRWQEREESGIGCVLSFSSTWGPEAEPPQSKDTLESQPQQFRQYWLLTVSRCTPGEVEIGRAIESRTIRRASGDRDTRGRTTKVC